MWATLLVAPLALQLPSSPDAPIGRRAALVGLSSYAVAALASPASAKKLDSDEVSVLCACGCVPLRWCKSYPIAETRMVCACE